MAMHLMPSKTRIHVRLLIENADLFSSSGVASKILRVGQSQ